jgi:SUKH-3 immunity protein
MRRNNSFNFDEDTKRILRGAGWSESRAVPTEPWVKALIAEGYVSSPIAEQILENLGGLKVTPPPDPQRVFMPSPFHLNPEHGGIGDFELVDFWQKDFGLTLFPLGEIAGYEILTATPDGKVFTVPFDGGEYLKGNFGDKYKSRFRLVGNTIEDALAVLCLARKKPVPYQL